MKSRVFISDDSDPSKLTVAVALCDASRAPTLLDPSHHIDSRVNNDVDLTQSFTCLYSRIRD